MTRKLPKTSIRDLEPRVQELLTMLTYKRPSGSAAEALFIERYLLPLGALRDEYGNHWLTVGEGSPILWSSHTDTVHKSSGSQRVTYGAHTAMQEGGSNCLGADCTVGVWLMVHMVRAGIPGTYIWHADEEIGGLGSSYIAHETPERLAGLQYAIAFDRKGYDEIITHQAMERCASGVFAASLAAVLHPLPYKASDGGTLTDTANYCRLIPECTNIAVGYHRQHSGMESQDVQFATRLLDRILSADWSRLICTRDPSIEEPAWFSDDRWGSGPAYAQDDYSLDNYVTRNPNMVAGFLEALGYTRDDIEDYAWSVSEVAPRERKLGYRSAKAGLQRKAA